MANIGSLTVIIVPNSTSTTMQLVGELDMATAPDVVRHHDGISPERCLTIDLRGLTFMDSSGLSALIGIAGTRSDLRLVPGPHAVQRVFEITDMVKQFEWVDPDAPLPETRAGAG